MIRSYTQRLLPPYSGVVQIAETEVARAQSFDGQNWEVHYLSGKDPSQREITRPRGYALDRGYFHVAHISKEELKPYRIPANLDAGAVTESIHELADYIANHPAPFPLADVHEYWLLDGQDESPLALIFSCCEEAQMAGYPPQTEWTAMPHSKLKVDNTDGEDARGEPPVNHRLQRSIARRAGARPRGAWFQRQPGDNADFPCLLIREDWQNPEDHDLCQRYLERKSPRLLMLHGLPYADRDRMETAAKAYALEVEEHFPLYPEVADETRMSALRVEARLRRFTPDVPTAKGKKEDEGIKPMSKDMRIIEN